jgi:hypothetical protein
MFIGMGPLFSGLGVIVLALWFCFPTLWREYLASTSAMIPAGEAALHFETVSESIFALIKGIFVTFGEDWLKSSIGLLVILSVALHISLSPQDIKGSLGALPIYCGLLLVATCALFWTPLSGKVLSWITLMNVRLFSLFALTVAFALVWLAFAGLYLRRKPMTLAGFAVAALYLTTLLGPCVMFRYIYPIAICVPFLFGCLMTPDRRQTEA